MRITLWQAGTKAGGSQLQNDPPKTYHSFQIWKLLVLSPPKLYIQGKTFWLIKLERIKRSFGYLHDELEFVDIDWERVPIGRFSFPNAALYLFLLPNGIILV